MATASAGDASDQEQLPRFCKLAPKVELHAHLNGSIREHTLVELAKERGVALPAKFLLHEAERHDPDQEWDVQFFNTKPRSLEECFEIFACIPKCVNDMPALRRITREVLEDAANDNIAYIELRTGPKVMLRDHRSEETECCTKRQYVEEIVEIMQEFETGERRRYREEMKQGRCDTVRLPLVPRLIISVDRSGKLEQAMENIDLAIEMRKQSNKCIVGVELGGNPTRNDFRLFEPAFAKARKAGLPVAIHCGEVPMRSKDSGGDEALQKAYEEAEAILHFRPNRLGHALLLADDLLMQQEKPIPIECCPTSNVMTLELALHHGGNLIDGMEKHPQLKKWLDSSYPVSVNTDDSGIFCTNLTKEFLLVAKAYGMGKSELAAIMLNSIEHIFDEKAKPMLRKSNL
ncbi:hypothetical protein ACHAXT_002910 [Thalassiosira profunda]